MPKRTNPFQQLVYLIQVQLKDRSDTTVTESKMLVNRTNGRRSREIDIVVECSPNGIPFILAFECTKRTRRPTIEWAEQMFAKHEHLSDKLVLVANRPFAADAVDYAREKGIETVELSEATKINWPAQIDEYTNMLFATFDFTIRLPECSVEYHLDPNQPPFNNDEMVIVANGIGQSAPITVVLDGIIRSHEGFAKRVMDLWYNLPKDQRRSEHTVTFEYVPPEPLTVTQGSLTYPLKKLTMVVGAKIGEAPLNISHLGFRGIQVAHGETKMTNGGLEGQTVRLVITEQRGQPPRAALMVSGNDRPTVRTAQLDPNGPVLMK